MSVTLHTYTKTEYKNAPDHKTTPLNATNLNNSEDGIENAYTDIAAVYSEQTTEDAKRALKSDLASISETGSTASQAISAGTYFYLNGTLVRAKTAIANGATFTLNTNYEVDSDGALNEPIIYSTTEHIVGKWTDGSLIYEKTVDCGALPNATSKNVAHGISNLSYVIEMKGTGVGSGVFIPLPAFNEGGNQLRLNVTSTNILFVTNANYSGYTSSYVTLRYTKSS